MNISRAIHNNACLLCETATAKLVSNNVRTVRGLVYWTSLLELQWIYRRLYVARCLLILSVVSGQLYRSASIDVDEHGVSLKWLRTSITSVREPRIATTDLQ